MLIFFLRFEISGDLAEAIVLGAAHDVRIQQAAMQARQTTPQTTSSAVRSAS